MFLTCSKTDSFIFVWTNFSEFHFLVVYAFFETDKTSLYGKQINVKFCLKKKDI